MVFEISLWQCAAIIIIFICIAFIYAIYMNGYYKRLGIIAASNALPFLGNMKKVFLYQEHLLQTVRRAYTENPDLKYIGFYAFNKPSIILKDLDLIKQVTVKDFDHFVDHKVFMDEDDDPLFGKNLFFLRGQKWRHMRVAMSPAYTGSKMKNMLPFIIECAEQLNDYIKKEMQDKKLKSGDILEIEMKDALSRFTNDAIASTAFGVKVNSLENKSNKFYQMSKQATNFSGFQFCKFFLYSSVPSVMKLFNIPLFSKEVSNFFRKLVYDSISSRESLGSTVRPDMIHLLMLAKKGSLSDEYEQVNKDILDKINKNESPKREWSHDDLTAQALAFVLAGLDTTSSLLSFTSYELSLNPDVQRKLQQEIDEVRMTLDGTVNYATLQKMEYLDMVVSETLRMWPSDSQLERVCVKSYDFPSQSDENEANIQINVGDDIWIPIYSIHHDAKYHPNPDKFDPERFSPENKPYMHQASFIPFGIGPRTCIGARFAVMEAKALIFNLLSQFNIVPTPKTPIPMVLAADTFTMQSKNGFWLGLQLRSDL